MHSQNPRLFGASLRTLRRSVAALFAVGMLAFAPAASAGSLHTTDDADLFSSAQLGAIRSHVDADDFDVRLLTSSSYASKSDFGNYVHRFVTEPNVVVIGVDPTHRHVSVHFGTGTRIADSEFKTIESAGIPYFKDGDWKGGVLAIVDRAEKAVGTAPGGGYGAGTHTRTTSTTSRSSGGSVFGFVMWTVLLLGVIGLLGWLFTRRSASSTTYVSGGGYGPPPMGGYGPGYGPPPPGPYYGGGGGSGLGSNIASAGIGGLIGYEIGKEVGESHARRYEEGYGGYGPVVHEYERPRQEWSGGGDSGQAGNYDAGGATGGWDDSGGGASDGGASDGGGGGDSDF
jgi:hypothetical protein